MKANVYIPITLFLTTNIHTIHNNMATATVMENAQSYEMERNK